MRKKLVEKITNDLIDVLNRYVDEYSVTFEEAWWAIGLLCYSYWRKVEEEGSVGVEGETDGEGVRAAG